MPSEVPPRVVGRYAIFDEIAAGGMATVHLGRLIGTAGFARTVAIKRLHSALAKDADFVTMLLDEARLASRIRHPNVVPTLDVIAEDEEVLLVMELVQGESLSRLMRALRPAPVPLPIAVAIAIQMLHGLHAAHEAKTERGEALNLVHRDVSPQNLLVGVDGVARVLDFGVAKAAHRAQTTREGQIKGKLSYMAPEQLRRDEVDRRTDIYASAIVLWEALTGERLFEGASEARTVMKILDEPVRTPSEVNVAVPASLDAIVMKGLSREASDRYATAREMAVALERSGLPIAPASVVGEWVESIASQSIALRARRLHEIESETQLAAVAAPPSSRRMATPATELRVEPEVLPSAGVYTSPTLTSNVRNAPGRRRAAYAGALLAVLFVGAFFGIAKLRESAPAAASADPPPPVVVSAPAVTLPPPPSTTTAVPIAASASAPASAPPVVKAAVRLAPPPPPPKKEDCRTPYTVDKDGIRHIKPGCL